MSTTESRRLYHITQELRRENDVLRSNSDHLSAENASLVRQVESMAMRIERLEREQPRSGEQALALAGELDETRAKLESMTNWCASAKPARKTPAEQRVLDAAKACAISWEDADAEPDANELPAERALYDATCQRPPAPALGSPQPVLEDALPPVAASGMFGMPEPLTAAEARAEGTSGAECVVSDAPCAYGECDACQIARGEDPINYAVPGERERGEALLRAYGRDV